MLSELLQVQSDQRDILWVAEFLRRVRTEPYWANTEFGFEAPDGFFYFGLFSERSDEAPHQVTVEELVQHATERGCGIAINPDRAQPDWFFTYGHLWSLRELGVFDVNVEGLTLPIEEVVVSGGGVLLSDPSPEFFPPYARTALRRYLARAGLNSVGVALVEDPEHEPQRSLLFSVFREDFHDEDRFDAVLYMIDWHLPPHYGMRSVAKDSEMAEGLVPL